MPMLLNAQHEDTEGASLRWRRVRAIRKERKKQVTCRRIPPIFEYNNPRPVVRVCDSPEYRKVRIKSP